MLTRGSHRGAGVWRSLASRAAAVPPSACLVSFDVHNPFAVTWAETRAGRLITGITSDMAAEIRALLRRAFVEGVPPRALAKQIQGVIGNLLTGRDARTLSRLEARLRSARPNQLVWIGQQKFRVPREGPTAAWVEHRLGTYAERLRRRRALVIARTETIAASNQGLLLQWDQAVRARQLTGREVRVWIVAHDDRLCPLCRHMENQRAMLGANFVAPNGEPIEAPPLHPQCRCTMGLVPEAPGAPPSPLAPRPPG